MWQMWARLDDGALMNVNESKFYVQEHIFDGSEPVQVTVTEDPDGNFYGWVYDVDGPYSNNGVPQFIQPHRGLYDMQFPYGPEATERAGRGKTVRLHVEVRS
jgi:hypothetical protein